MAINKTFVEHSILKASDLNELVTQANGYVHETDVKKDGFCALRYAHHLSWLPKWNEGIEVFHNFEILPEVDDWDKYLAKADVGFATKLIYDLDLLAKIEWDYNSRPAGDRKKTDLRYLVGLGYKW